MPALPPFLSAVSGATSSTLALVAVYPLDLIKTRLQVASIQPNTGSTEKRKSIITEVIQEEGEFGVNHERPHRATTKGIVANAIQSEKGWKELYEGMPAALIAQASNNFAYFYWYAFFKPYFTTKSTSQELLRGAIAGALGQLTTIPLSVIVTRQQTQSNNAKKNFWKLAHEIVSEQGWTALWTGLRPSLVLVVNPAITYGFFEKMKSILLARQRSLNALEVFIIGAIAKAIATVITYPYIMVKVKMQAAESRELEKMPSDSIGILRFMAKKDGVISWYKGLNAQISKAVLSQALIFVLKEKADKVIYILYILFQLATSR